MTAGTDLLDRSADRKRCAPTATGNALPEGSGSLRRGELEPDGTSRVDGEQRLTVALAVAGLLAARPDLDMLLPRFLACLTENLQAADTGVLLLYNPSEGQLTVRAAQGYVAATLSQIRIAPGEGMSGRVFQTGQARLYPDAAAIAASRANLVPKNRDLLRAASCGDRDPQSAVCVPLVANRERAIAGTTLGVLLLESQHESVRFAHGDLPFLQDLARLCTLSIRHMLSADAHDSGPGASLGESNGLEARLISTLAHEMRTPLTSIKGYSTALLLDEASFDPDTRREFLEIIDRECDVLRRAQPSERATSASLQCGELEIDFARHVVRVHGESVKLTRTEDPLLHQLAVHANRVVLHEDLLSAAWGPAYRNDVDYLRAYVHYLRRKLEADPANPRYILTSQGVGYMLALPEDADRRRSPGLAGSPLGTSGL